VVVACGAKRRAPIEEVNRLTEQITTTADYQALAQFRFVIRRFLNGSDSAARSVGLEPRHYVALLALRGLPSEQEASIRTLAEQLQIRHHSAVGLVDRMEKCGLLRRQPCIERRNTVLLSITARGKRLLSRLVRHRTTELRVKAPALIRALNSSLGGANWRDSRRGGQHLRVKARPALPKYRAGSD
jgi:DNA-binding MarR family transcriptional regulator